MLTDSQIQETVNNLKENKQNLYIYYVGTLVKCIGKRIRKKQQQNITSQKMKNRKLAVM